MDFDIERFISEIQAQPAIWNYQCDSYSNKIEKMKAWEKICEVFQQDFSELSNKGKNEIACRLQRKWKSLRDSFNRELRENKKVKSEDGFSSKKKYLYFNQLSFLLPLAEQRATTVDTDDAVPDGTTIAGGEKASSLPTPKKKRKVSKITEKISKINLPRNKLLNKQQNIVSNHDDGDRLFMLSLVNDLKRVPEDLKLDTKCELLQVLNKYKRGIQHAPHHYYNGFQNFTPSGYLPMGVPPLPTQSQPIVNHPVNPPVTHTTTSVPVYSYHRTSQTHSRSIDSPVSVLSTTTEED